MKKRLLTIYKATAKKNRLATRIFLSVIGIILMGFSMSILEKLNFGTDPYTCMNNGLSLHTDISLGSWGLIISGVLFIFVIAVRAEKIGIGTLVNMVGFGYSIDFFRFMWKCLGLESFSLHPLWRVVVLAVMLVLFICAVSLYLASDLGCAPYDAAPEIISELSKLKFVYVRIAWDFCAVLVGFLLGSSVGVTTLVCALGVGPAASIGKRLVKQWLDK